MIASSSTHGDLTQLGIHALLERLGLTDTVRFLQWLRPGSGDYAKERAALFNGLTLDDIIKRIELARPANSDAVGSQRTFASNTDRVEPGLTDCRPELALPELTQLGMQALLDGLGPAKTIRFIQQFHPGHGDYTQERHAWLDSLSIDDIIKEIEARRRESGDQPAPGE